MPHLTYSTLQNAS